MIKFMSSKAKQSKQARRRLEFESWFEGLDEESQQETTLKYLRSLDPQSLKRLYEAVDLYRKADKILKDKVKEPEQEPEQTQELNILNSNAEKK